MYLISNTFFISSKRLVVKNKKNKDCPSSQQYDGAKLEKRSNNKSAKNDKCLL